MPKQRPEYEVANDFKEIARKLVEKYDEQFVGIDVDKIQAVVITNKERPDRSEKYWEMIPVKPPVSMDCKYERYVIMYESDWDLMPEKNKYLLVAAVLTGIPVNDEGEAEEKVKPFDYKDYSVMARTFGVDYITKDNVPNILKEDINFVNV